MRGLAGFGLAILLVPILALALAPVEAVLATNVVAVLIGLSEWRRITREAERSALTICAVLVLTVLPGLWLLILTPPDIARVLIALVALSAFAAMLFPIRPATVPGRGATVAVGASAGVLTGFAGMPGPPVVPYYVGRAIERGQAKASMLLIFTIAAGAGVASGTMLDAMRWDLVWLGALLFPAVLLGNRLGNAASDRIADRTWRVCVGLVLAGAAAASLWKALG